MVSCACSFRVPDDSRHHAVLTETLLNIMPNFILIKKLLKNVLILTSTATKSCFFFLNWYGLSGNTGFPPEKRCPIVSYPANRLHVQKK